MAFRFPFSTLHELNLDWILEKVKTFAELIPPMETAVEDVQSLSADVQQAVEDAQQAVEDAGEALQTAEEAKEIAEQAAQGTIADGAVTTPKIADGAVTTPKIADDAVTLTKLAASVLATMLIVIDGNTATQAVNTGDYVIVRNSTITGITDGAYIALNDVAANTAFTSTDLYPVTAGVITDINSTVESIVDELHLNYKTVDVNGGGDFTSLTHALYTTSDNLVVKAGTYDIVSEYKIEFGNDIFNNINDSYTAIGMFRYGLYVDNRKIVFETGSQVECVLTGILTVDGSHRFSPFNLGSNAIITGLKCHAEDTFYLIHDDYGDVNGYYTNLTENCILYGSMVNANIIGGGTRNHSTNIVRNCILDNGDSTTETLRYHNYNSPTASPTVIIDNCRTNGSIGARYYGSQSTPKMKFISINNDATKVEKKAESISFNTDNVDLFEVNSGLPSFTYSSDGWQIWKFQNGLMIQYVALDGQFTFPANSSANKTFTFPVPFVNYSPFVLPSVNTTIPDKLHISTSAITYTTVTLTGTSSFVADQGPRISLFSIGLWK